MMFYSNHDECDWGAEPGPAPPLKAVCDEYVQLLHEKQLNCLGNRDDHQKCWGNKISIPNVWKRDGNVIQTGSFCSFTGMVKLEKIFQFDCKSILLL